MSVDIENIDDFNSSKNEVGIIDPDFFDKEGPVECP